MTDPCNYYPGIPLKTIWVLIDTSNSDGGRNYCWFFRTREQAREHMAWQSKQEFCAALSGPFKYALEKK